MIWIFVFAGALAVVTALKYLTPYYIRFLMERMVYRPQAEIDHILMHETPPEHWRSGYKRHMHACIRYMKTSTMVDASAEVRQQTVRRLEKILQQWERENIPSHKHRK